MFSTTNALTPIAADPCPDSSGDGALSLAEVEAAKAAAGDDAAAARLGELGLSFNRITRAVRLTMTLEARVRDVSRARLLGPGRYAGA